MARQKPDSQGQPLALARPLTQPVRRATIERVTRETSIRGELIVDGSGQAHVASGVPFLDHMLEAFARHGFFDLTLQASGDLAVDDHHTVEDVGIVLGRAFADALGTRAGIRRFGDAAVPLDEALVMAVVDFGGRAYLHYGLEFKQERVGQFQTELVHDFMHALADQARMNLHLVMHSGRNPHHIIEAAFKALARALDQATALEPRNIGVPSTKGTLT